MTVSWPNARLGDICNFVKGTFPTLKTAPGPYPLVVTAEYRRSADSWQLEGPAVCIPLISSTGHGNAALHRVHYQEGKFALANLLVALLPKNPKSLHPKFLYYLLMTEKDQLLVPLMLGTANVSLKEKDIAAVQIPLPPMSEQRRIVARIEELAAPIHEAQALRQQAAEEAEALFGSHLGVTFIEFAETHAVHPLGDLCSHILDGPHVTPSYLPEGADGIPFITVKNMVSGQLDFSNLKFISEADHRVFSRRCRPEFGDVLYSKDGATRGRPCLVDTDREFSFFVSVALLKPLRDQLDSHYLVHLLNSNWIKDRVADKSRGDMIPHIVLREICAFPVPLPPLPEQRQIVARLDTLRAEVDHLKALQTDAATGLDALLPAILDRAFKGEL